MGRDGMAWANVAELAANYLSGVVGVPTPCTLAHNPVLLCHADSQA